MDKKLWDIYTKLYRRFGPQGWWPADSDFEVMVGAILTQNTSWQNVEKAIQNLKKAHCLSFRSMRRLKRSALARLIRPAGYYNIKAARLKNFLAFMDKSYRGSIKAMRKKDACTLRRELLSVNGIGEETADSILLYALSKPIFVVDTYTRRIASRHSFISYDASYSSVQSLFMDHLSGDAEVFNEYHALLVRCAKDFCKKTGQKCGECPINEVSFHEKK